MMLRRGKKYENADKKTMIREEGEVNYKKKYDAIKNKLLGFNL